MNLLKETLKALEKNNKTIDDVRWIGTRQELAIDPKKYDEVLNIDYHNHDGIGKINIFLVVVGNNWWLERMYFDGAEWWSFKEMPERTINHYSDIKVRA